MATTQSRLEALEPQLDESIGVRPPTITRTQLSPVAAAKDVGRRPLRNVGRIKIEQVIPDPEQPRKEFSAESIDSLANSLRAQGQLAPIRVRWSANHNKWVIVCGERRWRAAHVAQLETIDCYFDESDRSQAELLEQQLVENLQREDLSRIDQARGFSALMELNDWNGKQVAESLHITASTVSRALALLDLPTEIQAQVDAGKIAARSAYEISKVDDTQRQRELADRAADGMSLSETQAAVRTQPRKKLAGTTPKKRLEFLSENGWKLIAIPPGDHSRRNYRYLQEAIDHVLEEVQLRIRGNIGID